MAIVNLDSLICCPPLLLNWSIFFSISIVNVKVMQRYRFLATGLLNPLVDKNGPSLAFVGLSSFLTFPGNICLALIQSAKAKSWERVQTRDDTSEIATNAED